MVNNFGSKSGLIIAGWGNDIYVGGGVSLVDGKGRGASETQKLSSIIFEDGSLDRSKNCYFICSV